MANLIEKQTVMRLKVHGSHLTFKDASKCRNVRERMEVVETNKDVRPFPYSPLNLLQWLRKKTLLSDFVFSELTLKLSCAMCFICRKIFMRVLFLDPRLWLEESYEPVRSSVRSSVGSFWLCSWN